MFFLHKLLVHLKIVNLTFLILELLNKKYRSLLLYKQLNTIDQKINKTLFKFENNLRFILKYFKFLCYYLCITKFQWKNLILKIKIYLNEIAMYHKV